uniref:Prostate-associated microseminoprotein n=1 Tax=Anabas testudineus TaxID=64144 RepID=A0A3Q1H718_ANATE
MFDNSIPLSPSLLRHHPFPLLPALSLTSLLPFPLLVTTWMCHCFYHFRALCVFEGTHYSLGETWMDKACMQCTCLHPVGVGCCETVHKPVDFPAWCEVRVEPVTCKVTLVQTADPRLPSAQTCSVNFPVKLVLIYPYQ